MGDEVWLGRGRAPVLMENEGGGGSITIAECVDVSLDPAAGGNATVPPPPAPNPLLFAPALLGSERHARRKIQTFLSGTKTPASLNP